MSELNDGFGFEGRGVDLILFPECSLSGFSSKISECSEAVLQPYLENIQEWSNRTGVQVVLPTAIVREGNIYNSGFVFAKNGKQQIYKIGLTDSEKNFFSLPTDSAPKVLQVRGYRLAILICHEAENAPWMYFNPESVDAILWPGYWGWTQESRWVESKVFLNHTHWKIPLLQANFSQNKLDGYEGSGPEGLSHIVGSDNQVVHLGAHLQEDAFIVNLEPKNGKLSVVSVETVLK